MGSFDSSQTTISEKEIKEKIIFSIYDSNSFEVSFYKQKRLMQA
jgi:hypothetical protein